jgi:hypothetical protein
MSIKRNVSEAKKKNVALRQRSRCANKPNSNIRGLENYNCNLWKIEGMDMGLFDESGYDIDHIIEHSIIADDSIENLQALCKMCHSVKTKRFLIDNPYKKRKVDDEQEIKLPIIKIDEISEKLIIIDDNPKMIEYNKYYSKLKKNQLKFNNSLSNFTGPQLKQLAILLGIIPHRINEKVAKQILETSTINNIISIIDKIKLKRFCWRFKDEISDTCHYIYANVFVINPIFTVEHEYDNGTTCEIDYYECPVCKNICNMTFVFNEYCIFTI